jgi:hypothetical protein
MTKLSDKELQEIGEKINSITEKSVDAIDKNGLLLSGAITACHKLLSHAKHQQELIDELEMLYEDCLQKLCPMPEESKEVKEAKKHAKELIKKAGG